MQKIVPHLWFNTEAQEASSFYVSLFPDSKITNVTTITDTPSGDCDMVSFTLAGESFMAISAGPYFSFNPSISLFVTCTSEEEATTLWSALSEGGTALMPFDTYPWAQKYGWVQDKYGLTWQLSWSESLPQAQKITPLLMFTQDKAGMAKEAIETYTSLFPNSTIEMALNYEEGEGDKVEYLKHARFTLNGQNFMAMDSSGPHAFTFNEAFSLIVKCDTQEEIDFFWEKLSAVPASEQCGWLKDKYGVSWQITPAIMDEMMASGDNDKIARVTQAFLQMKKFNIAALEEAYRN